VPGGPRAITAVGRVGRPHGLDGAFYVTGASPDLPREGVVRVADEPREIERRAGTDERPILRLSGVSSRTDAEALRGAELRAEVALEPDEYWAHELAGCAVVDGERAVGFVRRMTALPSCEVLEVDRPDGSELLVPLVRDAIRSIDVAARRIDVDLGFLGER
jgi:16S rRNA processing protein RimM